MATIKLESSDGELINTDIKVAKCFGVIRDYRKFLTPLSLDSKKRYCLSGGMIENQTLDEANCENEVVPLSVVDSGK